MSESEIFNTLTTIRYRKMMIDWLCNSQNLVYSELVNKDNLHLEDLIEKNDGSLIPMLEANNINMELPENE